MFKQNDLIIQAISEKIDEVEKLIAECYWGKVYQEAEKWKKLSVGLRKVCVDLGAKPEKFLRHKG